MALALCSSHIPTETARERTFGSPSRYLVRPHRQQKKQSSRRRWTRGMGKTAVRGPGYVRVARCWDHGRIDYQVSKRHFCSVADFWRLYIRGGHRGMRYIMEEEGGGGSDIISIQIIALLHQRTVCTYLLRPCEETLRLLVQDTLRKFTTTSGQVFEI